MLIWATTLNLSDKEDMMTHREDILKIIKGRPKLSPLSAKEIASTAGKEVKHIRDMLAELYHKKLIGRIKEDTRYLYYDVIFDDKDFINTRHQVIDGRLKCNMRGERVIEYSECHPNLLANECNLCIWGS